MELAYVLVRFFKTESCCKCMPCRVGTAQMLEALERLRKGYAKRADLERLEEIATYVKEASFCGLGQAAPVPILTGLRFFRDEFEAKLKEGWAKSTDDAKGSSRVEKTEDTNQADDIDSDGNGRVTKKEIAAKLKELGVEFDSRSSKADLEDLLNKSL